MSTDVELLRDDAVEDLTHKRARFIGLNMWNIYARVYDFLPRYFRPYQRLLADVISAVESNTLKGGRVLDSGCGTGNFSVGLGLRDYNVEGIDISTAMLQRARLKAKRAGLANVEFKEWDIERGLTCYPDATFDSVISVHTLYTLRNPEAAIREYFRVLKPSGHFIMAEPRSPIRIIPIVKEIYREGGLKELVKLVVTQSGVSACNLLIGKRLKNGTYHYWDEERLRNTLQGTCLRIDGVVPAYAAGSDLLTTAVKPRHFFEMNGYRFLSAEGREDLEKVWRLRYEVYCVELGDVPENQSGLERDEYDDYSISFLALDANDSAVGTLRGVHNSPVGFPMDKDFPLTDYMKTHGISRALEIGRYTIPKNVGRDARLTIVSGLFKCLYDYCSRTGINDVFATTQRKTLEKYVMPGVRVVGEPFRYSKPLRGGLWVALHVNALQAYQNYLSGVQTRAPVA
jgi:ubiquinone/menaquinone biosynthesis C-methylase UbiE/N-acyl-L-homoserine lactone synthetase